MPIEKTMERTDLLMPDKFVLYSGMRNPSNHEEISWQQFDDFKTKNQAQIAMRVQHKKHPGLWLIIRETPVAGMLPYPEAE